ncbi:MAG: hypothetical protein WBB98_15240 [Xanthobacteraceae bacterium]
MLPDYLASIASRSFRPGSLDCAVFMADWIKLVTGVDPIADQRGRYATTDEYRALVGREGGFIEACTVRAARIGLRKTDCPKSGDVMLVRAPVILHHGRVVRMPVGSIGVSATMRAVISSDRGLVIAGADVLPTVKAWTF